MIIYVYNLIYTNGRGWIYVHGLEDAEEVADSVSGT